MVIKTIGVRVITINYNRRLMEYVLHNTTIYDRTLKSSAEDKLLLWIRAHHVNAFNCPVWTRGARRYDASTFTLRGKGGIRVILIAHLYDSFQ